ncbi:MAG: S-adenosylmethionine decarboxylase [Gammaproteobacteria bacterium]|nr:S-adenosylmethionine decarboxylase [Gammaproteobacteria bacterium]
MYGKELILDLHDCDTSKFTRTDIKEYLDLLCSQIEMEREDLYFWDYMGDLEGYEKAPSHLKGTSCVQFIRTSNITIHTLDDLCKVFINIFSCKDFNAFKAKEFTELFFGGKVVNLWEIERL